MKTDPRLVELTQKFLKEFLDTAHEIDKEDTSNKRADLYHFNHMYHFNFTLAKAISECDYPKYKKEEQTTVLMGMASFDDSIAKAFFNERLQGFISVIENKLANLKESEQDDYYIKNVKTKKTEVDDFDIDIVKGPDGKNTIKTTPCKSPAEITSFDVSNSRSGFSGKVVIHKKYNKYKKAMLVDEIEFICNGSKVMTVGYKLQEDGSYKEEGTFTHYKHIADINSFYFTINNV